MTQTEQTINPVDDDTKGKQKMCYQIRNLWIVRHVINNRYIYITLFFLILPIIVYWFNFSQFGISDSTDNWGSFGDYIGGCCSIILALMALIITRKMDKKERRDRKQEEAIEVIFNQLAKIRNNDYDARHVNKLLRDIERNRLYLSEDLCNTLTRLCDYFLKVKDGVNDVNANREEEIILRLKSIYGT